MLDNFTIENDNFILNLALKKLLETTKDMVFIKDINSVYLAASPAFIKMVGKESAQDIINHNDFEIFENSELAKRYIFDDKKLIKKGKDLINYVEPLTDDNGNARYSSTSKYLLRDTQNNIVGILGIGKDITKEYIIQQHYQQELKHLFHLPENAYASVFIDIDDWRIVGQRRQEVNNLTIQSCYNIEDLIKYALASIVDKNSEVSSFYQNFTPEELKKIYNNGITNISFKYIRILSDNNKHWIRNTIRFLTDTETGHHCVMLIAKDIDAEKEAEEKLVMEAQIDKMTSLYNRETTMKFIRQVLENEPTKLHALFMVDLDNFKMLNDTYGHQCGDDFLIEFSQNLKNCFRENDIVGRIGGDEFFVLMNNIPDKNAAETKAQFLLDSTKDISKIYPTLPLSISIGISIYPFDGENITELYSQADKALYKAKAKGKNNFKSTN